MLNRGAQQVNKQYHAYFRKGVEIDILNTHFYNEIGGKQADVSSDDNSLPLPMDTCNTRVVIIIIFKCVVGFRGMGRGMMSIRVLVVPSS